MSPQESEKILRANPLDEIALTGAALGTLFGISVVSIFLVNFKQLPLYLTSLCIFHFLEYWITAKYNRGKVNKDSYLIRNGVLYIVAHMGSLIEASVEMYFFPQLKLSHSRLLIVGLSLVVFGQYLRSHAMITAGSSFSHVIAEEKKQEHVLVTSGVYSISRHPSYSGFFWWATGTQILLCNPVCFIWFLYALWRFFSHRIRCE